MEQALAVTLLPRSVSDVERTHKHVTSSAQGDGVITAPALSRLGQASLVHTGTEPLNLPGPSCVELGACGHHKGRDHLDKHRSSFPPWSRGMCEPEPHRPHTPG